MDMLLFSMKKNLIFIFFIALLSGIAQIVLQTQTFLCIAKTGPVVQHQTQFWCTCCSIQRNSSLDTVGQSWFLKLCMLDWLTISVRYVTFRYIGRLTFHAAVSATSTFTESRQINPLHIFESDKNDKKKNFSRKQST